MLPLIQNLYIHDLTIKNGHGFSFGSALHHDITDVRAENIDIEGSWHAIRIKFNEPKKPKESPKLENLLFKNFVAKNLTRGAVRITDKYGKEPHKGARLKNIKIQNLTVSGSPIILRLDLADKKEALTPLVIENLKASGIKNKDKIKNYPVMIDGKEVAQ